MADIGAIKSFLGGLPSDQKLALEQCFTYVLNNLSFGAVDTDRTARATNFQAYYLTGTTSSNANTEFSIPHGLDSAPNVLFPVLPLDQVGSQIVPLQVSRAADTRRVYLKSSSTSAAIAVMVG